MPAKNIFFSFFKHLSGAVFFLCLIIVLVATFVLYNLVVIDPGPEIEEKNIAQILGRESQFFYKDGSHKLGVVFQDYHRQYIDYDKIPKTFIQAIVAAEDQRFFTHYGIDPAGITRAMINNFKAGRVVQGGSTLTQQTAKNLFKRSGRNIKEKLKELLFALRLEYHYSKEKILEFYCNQFYVSGNGHGLGIAARYFFNKSPQDLNLIESAFIAGSVKQPNKYNPFIKKTPEAEELAMKLARTRTDYVLGNMLELGMISQEDYQKALATEIPFNRGAISYPVSTVMDLVREGIESETITAALEAHGISNIATAGVRVIATVDYDLQRKTETALNKQLSYLTTLLEGYTREDVQVQYAGLRLRPKDELEVGDFTIGRIVAITDRNGDNIRLEIVTPGEMLPVGYIDWKGLEKTATALRKNQQGRWAKVNKKAAVTALMQKIKSGDLVYVMAREVDAEGETVLNLERYPTVQGAAILLHEGAIVSMTGGAENKFLNRAVQSKRVMGSTWKPFLFTAAMQLGWSSLDLLDNQRNAFVYQGKPYFPRPDHKSPFRKVSMSWAGVKSENIASIWLLYHLTDYLSQARIEELARELDMTPRVYDDGQVESYRTFSNRMKEKFGVFVNKESLQQAAYEIAIKQLEADFLFEDRAKEYERLKRTPYGANFNKFNRALSNALGSRGASAKEKQELWNRKYLLSRSFTGLQATASLLAQQQNFFEALVDREDLTYQFFSFFDSEPEPLPETPAGSFFLNDLGEISFTRGSVPKNKQPFDTRAMVNKLQELSPGERAFFWDSVQIEGVLSRWGINHVARMMQNELDNLRSKDPYSMYVLSNVRDYKVALGIQYLVKLGRECGLTSRLDPVLSLPLGSNVISLIEATKMYETITTGLRHDSKTEVGFTDQETQSIKEQLNGLAIIERIESKEGKLLYQREVAPQQVVDPKTNAAVANILENVVRYGTGYSARTQTRLRSTDPERDERLKKMNIKIPLMGKTGTANDFRNATFLGFVPTLSEDSNNMVIEGGHALGVYVGYDDNKPLKNKSNRISGASGALPVWTEIANELLISEQVGEKVDIDKKKISRIPLKYPEVGQLFVPVQHKGGGVIARGKKPIKTTIAPAGPTVLSYGVSGPGGRFKPERYFQPFWLNRGYEEGN